MAARSVDLVARLIADSRNFKRGMDEASLSAKQAQFKIRSIGKSTEQLGRNLTRNVSLPLAAVGVAAIKTFTDFEQSISKIGALVLGTSDGLDRLAEDVKGLAGTTARAPQELADAMFSVQSAGLRGQEAMDTLEIAAKGAAAGLGSTKDIALAAAGAMTSYGREGLTASRSTDILAATVREGNLEAADLAASLGNVTGVAAAAGVGLDDVGAAVALITRQGLGASEAVTQVAAAVKQLNAPTQRTIPLVEAAFGSLDNLREMLSADDGLLTVFRQLTTQYGAQPEKLRQLLGSSEALNAVLAITGQDAAEVDRVFKSLDDSTGSTQAAFDIMSDTAGFQFSQAMADAKVALIDLGAVAAPIAADVAGGVAGMARAFSDLSPAAQAAIATMGGLAILVGPVTTLVGKILQTKTVTEALTAGSIRGGLRSLTSGFSGMALAAGAAVGAVVLIKGELDRIERSAKELGDRVRGALSDDTFAEAKSNLTIILSDMNSLRDSANESINPFDVFYRRELRAGADELERIAEATALGIRQTSDLAAQFGISEDAVLKFGRAAGVDAAGDMDELRDAVHKARFEELNPLPPAADAAREALDEFAGGADNAADEIKELERAIDAIFNEFFGLQEAEDAATRATQELTANVLAQRRELGPAGAALKGNTEAALDNREALRDLAGTYVDLLVEFREHNTSADAVKAKQDELVGRFESSAAAAGLSKDEVQLFSAAIGAVPTSPNVAFNVTGLPSLESAVRWTQRLLSNGSIDVNMGVQGISGFRAHGGPVSAGRTFLVGEEGPELFSPSTNGNIIPNSQLGGAGGTTNVTILMPPGSDGDDVVAALRRWMRRNGSIPITTNG